MNKLRLDTPCRTKPQPEYVARADIDADTFDRDTDGALNEWLDELDELEEPND